MNCCGKNVLDLFRRKAGELMAIPYSRTVMGLLPWYSVLVVTGIASAIWLAAREEKRLNLPGDTAVDLALLVVPCGILGARLYYVAMSWPQFAADPVSALYIWRGGLAIYGGVIGGSTAAWIYSHKKRISIAMVEDMIAPGLLLAQAIGRWGNYFNMEAYGPVIADQRFQFFPLGVLIPEAGGYAWRMATFFYESMWNLAGFAVLWAIRKKQDRSGHVFCWYLVIYGAGRFVIEQLRQDSLYVGTLRASQWLSLLLCSAAAWKLLAHKTEQSPRERGFCLACAGMWFVRWACLDQPLAYIVLMLLAGVGGIWLLRHSRSLGLLALMIAADAAGLVLGLHGGAFAMLAHALLCSLTLTGYLMALYMRKD